MLETHFFFCYNRLEVRTVEVLLEGILEGLLELVLDAASDKKVHWSLRLLASLVLLAVCVALCGLGVYGTVYLAREGSVVGAVIVGLVCLFVFGLIVAVYVCKAREIKKKQKSVALNSEIEPTDELWDLYTAENKLSKQKIKRGDAIPKGLYHMVCEILVLHKDGSYLCMKRASAKENYPNCYESTAGGSALSGEDKWQCAKRELREETGLSCNNLKELAVIRDEEKQTVYYCFLGIVDCEKDSVRLQTGETEGYVWLSEKKFAEFLNSDKVIEPQKKRFEGYFKEKGYI